MVQNKERELYYEKTDTNTCRFVVWFKCFAKSVQADEYNTSVIDHVIKEKVSGNGVDMSVLENEMQKLAYSFEFRNDRCFRKTFAQILESLAQEIK